MKRLLVYCICMSLVIGIYARTTYIPFYSSSISITENGITKVVEGEANQLSLSTMDNGVSFTVLHELVTADKVKFIKSAKKSAGWSTVAVGLSQGRGTAEALAGSAIVNSAKEAAEEAKVLSIELLIENNSGEDIFVGDMNNGAAYWHIPAKGSLSVRLDNPKWFQLRVTNAHPDDNIERAQGWKQKVAYVTIGARGYVEKKTIEYETDSQIVYTSETDYTADVYAPKAYVLFDKQTSVSTPITKEEYTMLKKQTKKAKREYDLEYE